MKRLTPGEVILICTMLVTAGTTIGTTKAVINGLSHRVETLERNTATREGAEGIVRRLDRIDAMLTNGGLSEKLAVNIKSNAELRSEVDEMWRVLNMKDPAAKIGQLEGRMSALERMLAGG